MNLQKMLEQLKLAQDAGDQAEAESFFKPVPGQAQEEPAAGDAGGVPALEGSLAEEGGGGASAEQLEELLQALGAGGQG